MAATMSAPQTKCSVQSLEAKFKLPFGTLARFGVIDRPGGVRIDYGSGYRAQVRTALSGEHRFHYETGSKDPVGVYGLHRLSEMAGDGYSFIVEGPSDCWTLWFNEFPALGLPGASMAVKLLPEHLRDIHELFICREPDSGGQTFVDGLLKRLKELKFKGRAWVLDMEKTFGVKDPAELHCKDPARFPSRLQAALDSLREQTPDYDGTAQPEPTCAAEGPKEPARQPAKGPALVALDISELLLEPSPIKRYLFRKLITSQSLGMLYGFRGYGKSHCVHNIAFTCASGGVFLGFVAETPVKTILIDGELPMNVLQERFAALITGADGKEPPPGYLRIVVGEK